jgi:hypothetical protein
MPSACNLICSAALLDQQLATREKCPPPVDADWSGAVDRDASDPLRTAQSCEVVCDFHFLFPCNSTTSESRHAISSRPRSAGILWRRGVALVNIARLAKDLFIDGYKFIGIAAPLASLAFTIAKCIGIETLQIQSISFGWAFAPLFAWTLVAYSRRWSDADEFVGALALDRVFMETRFAKNQVGECIRYEIRLRNLHSKAIECRMRSISIGGIVLPAQPDVALKIGAINDSKIDVVLTISDEFHRKHIAGHERVPIDAEFTYGPIGSGGTRAMRIRRKFTYYLSDWDGLG